MSTLPPDPTPPPITEADLADHYIRDHQTTVYQNGQFWRQPWPNRPWVHVPDPQIVSELLETCQLFQTQGFAPTRHRLGSVLHLLRIKLGATIDPGQWDNTVGYLPFLNILKPLFYGPHDDIEYSKDHFIATTFPYNYDLMQACPHWLAFLQATVPHAADFIQEFAGYCLTHFTHFELSLWLCGAPSSGKSTLLHGFQTLLGDFAARLSLADLALRRLDPHTVNGKRLLIADEAPPNFYAIPALAPLIDGTPFHLARPHGLPFQVQTQAKLILGFNALPAVDSRFASLYRRAALLVFPPRPPGAEDHRLKDRISAEGPGLFNWAMRGLARLLHRGRFEPPATMLAAADHLRLATSSPADFIDQCCLRKPNGRTQSADLIQAYRAWCAAQDLLPLNRNRLATYWEDLGFERTRIKGRSVWHGVQLLPQPKAPVILADPTPPALSSPASPA